MHSIISAEMNYLPLSLFLAALGVTKANCVLKGTQGHDQINGIVFFEVRMECNWLSIILIYLYDCLFPFFLCLLLDIRNKMESPQSLLKSTD